MQHSSRPPHGVLLMILDGWGLATDPATSAIDAARTPFYDYCRAHYPTSYLEASERAVGLPKGQMGNSEVGHLNLGAGRVVYQELERIGLAFQNHAVTDLPAMQALLRYAKGGHRVHLMGLVSDGGVHSHIEHLKQLVTLLADEGIREVYLHVFTDGRDTDPLSGLGYLQQLERHLQATHCGQVATVIGRYFAMDRDKRWSRIQRAYNLLVRGEGKPFASATEALEAAYSEGVTDEFVPASVIVRESQPVATVQPGDAVVFFNFRTDRGRQLTQALTQTPFPAEGMAPLPLHYLTFTSYDETFAGVHVLFNNDKLTGTLGEVLARHGRTQLRIAETEKYPHVTFFFSGGREAPYPGEDRILCPSPQVATYDLAPEMAAYDIRDALLARLEAKRYDFICLNFANPDMVGHTGVFDAAVKACEVVDGCAQAVAEAAQRQGYHVIVLADHGNADRLLNPDGSPHTAHTLARVPFIFIPADGGSYTLAPGVLGDVAPSILELLGIPVPAEMTGERRIHAAVPV